MRRSVLLVLMVAVAMLAFAPAALAQMDDNPSADDMGADDNGGGGDRGFDDNPSASDLMERPAASASAASSATSSATATAPADDATATASATAGDDATATASAGAYDDARAAAGGKLPNTGGPPVAGLISAAAAVLLVGSGLVAARLVRRDR